MPQRCPAILMTRHARHRHSTDASAHRQHPRSLHHRCRLSRPQRPARLQVLYTTGQKRRLTPQIKHEFKRRAAIEPVIGHLKEHHASGDAINAVLAATGYNFRRLLAWLRFLLLTILIALGLAA
jgi:IS5 family transposase